MAVLAKDFFQARRWCRWPRFAKRLLASAAALGIGFPTVGNGSLTLTWDPSPSETVVGYRIYYGLVTHSYTLQIDVGNQTAATVTNLLPGRTYYFAATAYTALGVESEFSDEVSARVPLPPPEPGLPIAEGQELTTEMDVPLPIVLGSETGQSGPLEYVVTLPPDHGSLSPEAIGPERVYTPDAAFTGLQAISYRVSDGRRFSKAGAIAIRDPCLRREG